MMLPDINQEKIERARLARRIMRWAAFLGLFGSLYLLYVYTTGGQIRCGLSGGCETVRASAWAYPLGVPMPLFGVLFYLGVISMLMRRVFSPTPWQRQKRLALVALAAIGFLTSAFLTGVEAFDIKAYCTWCVVSAIAATIIFIAVWYDIEAQPDEKPSMTEMKRFFVDLAIATVVGALAMIWLIAKPGSSPSAVSPLAPRQIISASSTGMLLPPDVPFEGPMASKVTIVEFVDYECSGCAVYQPVLKKIRKEFYGKIRFATRQFPLVEIHPRAKGAAIAAVCSERQGKYYVYTDSLFGNRERLAREDLERYAGEQGMDVAAFKTCLDDPEAERTVIRDRKDGELFGVRSTPTIFINGKMRQDLPFEDELRKILSSMLY